MVYLEHVQLSNQILVDSIKLDESGAYRFEIQGVGKTPSLYNVVYNNERIPLLLLEGESVELSAIGSVMAHYTVSGSHESELLRKFNLEYVLGAERLNEKMAEYAISEGDARGNVAREYNSLYRDLKRKQISFIIENKGCIAAVYALYQRLPGEKFLSSADSDVIYFRTVADAIQEVYPTSPFLITLRNDVARMEARVSLLHSIEERSYPNLKAADMYGNEIELSSLDGDVILVDFWSAEIGNSNALNADLKEIYNKYHSSGFSVYQVSVDTLKSVWITAVQEQHLPWISVCDFKGARSPMVGVYNVKNVPANYLIDRNGSIVAKNLYGAALEKKLQQLL
ncbi:MAG: AhpC/TSA family protein [Alistipes sp.]|nr:AhpC/TSA family protein [Candidatus Alistipes equi]